MTQNERKLLRMVALCLAELLTERDDYQHGPDLKQANALMRLSLKVEEDAKA